MARLVELSYLGDVQIDSGVTGRNARNRVRRERHAPLQIGGASARGMGLLDIMLRTRVCNLFRCFD